MSRKTLIQPVKMSNTTPVRNSTNITAKTCLLDGEMGYIDMGAGLRALIIGSEWEANGHFIVGPSIIPHTFTMEGDVTVKTLPGFFPLWGSSGNTNYPRKAQLVGAIGKLGAGTATVEIRIGGTTVTPNGSRSLTTSVNSTSIGVQITSDQYLDLNITAASGATNLSLTVFVMYH
jgi:hypothetical protein